MLRKRLGPWKKGDTKHKAALPSLRPWSGGPEPLRPHSVHTHGPGRKGRTNGGGGEGTRHHQDWRGWLLPQVTGSERRREPCGPWMWGWDTHAHSMVGRLPAPGPTAHCG